MLVLSAVLIGFALIILISGALIFGMIALELVRRR